MKTLQEKFEDIFKPDDGQVELNELKKKLDYIMEDLALSAIKNYTSGLIYDSFKTDISNEIISSEDFTDEELKTLSETFDEKRMYNAFELVMDNLYTHLCRYEGPKYGR